MSEPVVVQADPEVACAPFRREGLGYVYEPEGYGLRLRADYLDVGKSELAAEIVAETCDPGMPPHLLRTRLNLLVSKNLSNLAGQIQALYPHPGKGWDGVVRAFGEAVIQAEREGEPFLRIGARPAKLRPADRVERLLVEGKPTSIYGEGGAGKGYLAVALSVAVQGGYDFCNLRAKQGNTLYLDWDDDDDETEERIREVCRGLAVPPVELDYRRMAGPLDRQLHQVAQHISAAGIQFVVIDPVEMAMGAGEYGTYEIGAKRLAGAIRSLGPVTTLLIDHVSEGARRDGKTVNKAYGSIMKGNNWRRSWEVKVDIDHDRTQNHLGLYPFKTNRGALGRPIGFLLDFTTPGAVRIEREDVRDNPVLNQALPHHERLEQVLLRGPATPHDLKDQTGIDEATIRVTLNRKKERFRRLDDGRWAVLDRRPPRLPIEPAGVTRDVTEEAHELPF